MFGKHCTETYSTRYFPLLLLALQAVESLVEGHIIPFNGGDLVVAHAREGVDQVSTEAGVEVLGREAPQAWPVLSPVGEVAYQLVGRACGQ